MNNYVVFRSEKGGEVAVETIPISQGLLFVSRILRNFLVSCSRLVLSVASSLLRSLSVHDVVKFLALITRFDCMYNRIDRNNFTNDITLQFHCITRNDRGSTT